MKQNCWEFKQCGRQPDGTKVAELGVCPAAVDHRYNGVNGGSESGRLCWYVAGTFCGEKPQGEFAQKRLTCMTCEFYLKVKAEEGRSFVLETSAATIH